MGKFDTVYERISSMRQFWIIMANEDGWAKGFSSLWQKKKKKSGNLKVTKKETKKCINITGPRNTHTNYTH
jgi:hypothetical protein